MISIYSHKDTATKNNTVMVELRGLSTDQKPTVLGSKTIDNGSIFIEIDTGKLFFYDLDNQQWLEVGADNSLNDGLE